MNLKQNNIDSINLQSNEIKIKERIKKLQNEFNLIVQEEKTIDKKFNALIEVKKKLQLKKNLNLSDKKQLHLYLIQETDLEVKKKLLQIRKETNQELLQSVKEEIGVDKDFLNQQQLNNDNLSEFNGDPKKLLQEELSLVLLKEEQKLINLLKNTRELYEERGYPEFFIANKMNRFHEIHLNHVQRIKNTYLQKMEEVETNKEVRESIFKNYFIEKKNRLFSIDKSSDTVSMSELRYREIQKQNLLEDKRYKEQHKEQEKWKLFKEEIRNMVNTPMTFTAAMNYLELFFGKNLNERLFSVIRDRDISFLNIPLNEKRVFKINFTYKERENLFITLYAILKAYFEGERSIKILANSLFLSLLHLLYIKDFITQCVYSDDEYFEISFTRSIDPYFNNKFIYYSILWTSDIDDPFYCSYEDLKLLFHNKKYFFTFGLVLTEIGFRSILDCIHKKIGGELILLIIIRKNR